MLTLIDDAAIERARRHFVEKYLEYLSTEDCRRITELEGAECLAAVLESLCAKWIAKGTIKSEASWTVSIAKNTRSRFDKRKGIRPVKRSFGFSRSVQRLDGPRIRNHFEEACSGIFMMIPEAHEPVYIYTEDFYEKHKMITNADSAPSSTCSESDKEDDDDEDYQDDSDARSDESGDGEEQEETLATAVDREDTRERRDKKRELKRARIEKRQRQGDDQQAEDHEAGSDDSGVVSVHSKDGSAQRDRNEGPQRPRSSKSSRSLEWQRNLTGARQQARPSPAFEAAPTESALRMRFTGPKSRLDRLDTLLNRSRTSHARSAIPSSSLGRPMASLHRFANPRRTRTAKKDFNLTSAARGGGLLGNTGLIEDETERETARPVPQKPPERVDIFDLVEKVSRGPFAVTSQLNKTDSTPTSATNPYATAAPTTPPYYVPPPPGSPPFYAPPPPPPPARPPFYAPPPMDDFAVQDSAEYPEENYGGEHSYHQYSTDFYDASADVTGNDFDHPVENDEDVGSSNGLQPAAGTSSSFFNSHHGHRTNQPPRESTAESELLQQDPPFDPDQFHNTIAAINNWLSEAEAFTSQPYAPPPVSSHEEATVNGGDVPKSNAADQAVHISNAIDPNVYRNRFRPEDFIHEPPCINIHPPDPLPHLNLGPDLTDGSPSFFFQQFFTPTDRNLPNSVSTPSDPSPSGLRPVEPHHDRGEEDQERRKETALHSHHPTNVFAAPLPINPSPSHFRHVVHHEQTTMDAEQDQEGSEEESPPFHQSPPLAADVPPASPSSAVSAQSPTIQDTSSSRADGTQIHPNDWLLSTHLVPRASLPPVSNSAPSTSSTLVPEEHGGTPFSSSRSPKVQPSNESAASLSKGKAVMRDGAERTAQERSPLKPPPIRINPRPPASHDERDSQASFSPGPSMGQRENLKRKAPSQEPSASGDTPSHDVATKKQKTNPVVTPKPVPGFPFPVVASVKALSGSKNTKVEHLARGRKFMAAHPVHMRLPPYVDVRAYVEHFMVGEETTRGSSVRTAPGGMKVTAFEFEVVGSKILRALNPAAGEDGTGGDDGAGEGSSKGAARGGEGSSKGAARGAESLSNGAAGGAAKKGRKEELSRRAFLYFFSENDITYKFFKENFKLKAGYVDGKQFNCSNMFGIFPMFEVTRALRAVPSTDRTRFTFRFEVTTPKAFKSKIMAVLFVFDMLTLDEKLARVYEVTAKYLGVPNIPPRPLSLTATPATPRNLPNLHDEILRVIGDRPFSVSGTTGELFEKLRHKSKTTAAVAMEDGADVVVEEAVVSTKCPFTFGRIVHPGKGRLCSHLQCFDVKDLVVDPFFLRLLLEHPTAERCLIRRDGRVIPLEEPAGDDRRSAAEVVFDVDEPPKKKQRLGSGKTKPTVGPTRRVVDSSDEEEVEEEEAGSAQRKRRVVESDDEEEEEECGAQQEEEEVEVKEEEWRVVMREEEEEEEEEDGCNIRISLDSDTDSE
ncbi:hypothetical protein HDU96_008583 [Phlyctochytrium bullatum]|nr:hypothetical protein HDU96_008583 [Phlyctochytrium bullatum]